VYTCLSGYPVVGGYTVTYVTTFIVLALARSFETDSRSSNYGPGASQYCSRASLILFRSEP
jgi:hypothetical protein